MYCFVILAIGNVKEDTKWASTTNDWVKIHDILVFTWEYYEISYAENSRETFRKQAMHHFRNAVLIEDNGKATNSPNYRCRLADEFLSLVKTIILNYGGRKKQNSFQITNH